MTLDLSKFKLQKVVLEIRYDPAFLLWDNAGTVWFTLRSKFPAQRLKTAQPNQQIMSLSKDLEGTTELDRAFLQGTFPAQDLEAFRAAADIFFSCIIRQLDITDLSRVGMRLIYEKTFESRREASDYVLTCKPSLQRDGKFFNAEGGKVLDPEFFLRWEGDAIGCSVKVFSVEQRIQVGTPSEFPEVTPIDVTRNSAILDIDYYAHASMPVSKFNAPALIENWLRTVRRDVGGFVGA